MDDRSAERTLLKGLLKRADATSSEMLAALRTLVAEEVLSLRALKRCVKKAPKNVKQLLNGYDTQLRVWSFAED